MTRTLNSKAAPHASGARALARAAAAGDAAGVASLLAAGVAADAALPNGETALMRAAAHGFEDVARVLLSKGADVDARRADGFAPLILAAFFGHAGVARLLLEHGADTAAGTRLGTTAKGWAAARGFADISALVEAAEADPRRREAAAAERASRQIPAGRAALNVLVADLAPDGSEENGPGQHVGGVESEMRARASEVSLIFGEKSGGGDGQADDAAGDEVTRLTVRERPPGAGGDDPAPDADFAPQAGMLFAASQPAKRLRSWQGTAGLILLAVACVSAVYAAWRSTRTDGAAGRAVASPQNAVAQPAAPLPAAQPSASAQPSPGVTPVGVEGVSPPGAVGWDAFAPYPSGEPVNNAPAATNPNGGAAPPAAVVSENGATPNANNPAARREAEAAARSARGAGDAAAGDDNSRVAPPRVVEQAPIVRPPVVSVPQPRPAPAEPAATPTPRGKVIQWPPS